MKVPNNFGGIEKPYSEYKKAKIVVLPIPFDKTSTWIKGADKGPQAIITASQNMELYDIQTDFEVYKKGIFTEKPIQAASPAEMVEKIRLKVKELLADKKFVVCLGGEHSISLGPIQAHAAAFANLSVLHLDAHSDRRDCYLADEFNHACVIARAKEVCKNIVSVGIRSMDCCELKNTKKDTIFYAHRIRNSKNWISEVIKKLTKNVYITCDLDVFDPAFVPATGTPEPGGLDWYQVTDLLRAVAKAKNVVGFDVVELCPVKENKTSDFLAAKLIHTLLSHIFVQKR